MLDNPEQERAYKLGKLRKEWRLDLGMNRPKFISEIAKHGQDMSAAYLSKLETVICLERGKC